MDLIEDQIRKILQHPKIYNAFVDIWGTEKPWVTIDRANLNFPVRDDYHFKGYAFPGDPREWEKKQAKTAGLTVLGKNYWG